MLGGCSGYPKSKQTWRRSINYRNSTSNYHNTIAKVKISLIVTTTTGQVFLFNVVLITHDALLYQ